MHIKFVFLNVFRLFLIVVSIVDKGKQSRVVRRSWLCLWQIAIFMIDIY